MNLAHFPFDIQMCTVEIESFGYTMADMRYAWNSGDSSVQMSPDVSLPQFNILGHRQRLIEVIMRLAENIINNLISPDRNGRMQSLSVLSLVLMKKTNCRSVWARGTTLACWRTWYSPGRWDTTWFRYPGICHTLLRSWRLNGFFFLEIQLSLLKSTKRRINRKLENLRKDFSRLERYILQSIVKVYWNHHTACPILYTASLFILQCLQ